jgi:hypothetical protein
VPAFACAPPCALSARIASRRLAPPGRLRLIAALALLILTTAAAVARAADEIHWTIMGPDAVSFDWRGPENQIAFGNAPGAYTKIVAARTPSPLPNSSAGPFWEARITGLAPNTLYYYRLGDVESTFRTPPAAGSSNFWVSVQADIGSSLAYDGVVPLQNMIAADHAGIAGDDRPRFVLVPGDLTYGDNRGRAHVDQHFNDVMVWSKWAAYMPIWGNHEWGSSTDDLQNYEGRFDLPNTQTSPNAPSSGGPGDDWYWFDYGNARFIAFPEPYSRAWDDWEIKAGAVMALAQANDAIDFIVVFGHRPPYSSGADHGGNESLAENLAALKRLYPKFVMTLSGHTHHYERSDPDQTDGITHVISGGGGSTLGGLTSTRPSWSEFRMDHFQYVKLHVQDDRIDGYCVCGPDGGDAEDDCTPGTIVDRWTIFRPGAGGGGDGGDDGGGDGDSTVVGNRPPLARLKATPATGAAPLRVALDASATTDPDGDPLEYVFLPGNGTLYPKAGATLDHTFGPGAWIATMIATDVHGASDTASVVVTATNVAADSLGPELVTNPSFESSTTGWSIYGRAAMQRMPGGHHGRWSLHVRSGGYAQIFGLGDHPNWIPEVPLAGVRYRVAAYVRSLGTLGRCRLLLREFKDGERVGSASSPWVHPTHDWKRLEIDYEAVSAGSHLDLQILEDPATVYESFLVDDVSIRMIIDPVTNEPYVSKQVTPKPSHEESAHGEEAHEAADEIAATEPALDTAPRVIPNPMFGNATLAFATPRPGPLRVELYDASGRIVRRLRDDAVLPAGRHQIEVPGRNAGGAALPAGIYFCVLQSTRGRETVRVAIVR